MGVSQQCISINQSVYYIALTHFMLIFCRFEYMELLLKYRFFVLMTICIALQYFIDGSSDLATIVFFIAILDLSNVMSKSKK